jgi:hypothetical protein
LCCRRANAIAAPGDNGDFTRKTLHTSSLQALRGNAFNNIALQK